MSQRDETVHSVVDSYAGFVAQEAVYLHEVLECHPGTLGTFVEQFGSSLGERHERSPSLVPIGAWYTICGAGDEVNHLYAFDRLSDAEVLVSDNGQIVHHLDVATPNLGRLLRRRSSKLMGAVSYAPPGLIDPPSDGEVDRRIYLSVEVHCTRSGLGEYLTNFGSGIKHRAELSANLVPIGAWRALYGGPYYEVDHLYAYDSLEEMERLRKVLYEDEEFQRHMSTNTSPHPPRFWEWGGSSKLMKRLPYPPSS
jgi:hypothetical protein